MEMVAKRAVKPENIPPTESTAINHSLRVHQQTVTWKKLAADTQDLLQWCWKEKNENLALVQTENRIPHLLNLFFHFQVSSLDVNLDKDVEQDGKTFDIFQE